MACFQVIPGFIVFCRSDLFAFKVKILYLMIKLYLFRSSRHSFGCPASLQFKAGWLAHEALTVFVAVHDAFFPAKVLKLAQGGFKVVWMINIYCCHVCSFVGVIISLSQILIRQTGQNDCSLGQILIRIFFAETQSCQGFAVVAWSNINTLLEHYYEAIAVRYYTRGKRGRLFQYKSR